ncbi:MAG TPA: hypothetical protein VIX17_15375 [Pyrinomonadaceae bacterium]|jgi:hypothetical protein
MRNKIFSSIAMLSLFFVLAVAGVQAQRPTSVEVNLPFDFTAGKATLKAGRYHLRKLSGDIISIRSEDGKVVMVNAPLTVGSRDLKSGSRLVFNRYGDAYFLTQVWLKTEIGQQLFPTKSESKVRDSEFAKGIKAERVEVSVNSN